MQDDQKTEKGEAKREIAKSQEVGFEEFDCRCD